MNFKEIAQLISHGEGDKLEFKATTGQITEVGKTLCGFLNQKGGITLIGVKDKGEITGQQVSDKTQQEIAQMLNDITPSAPIDCDFIKVPNSDKKIIILKTHTPIPPAVYHFRDKAYERRGSSTRAIKYERLRQLMLERAHDKIWDQLPAEGYTQDNLDADEIFRTVDEGVKNGRLDEEVVKKDDLFSVLQGLDLTTNGDLTNAAVILYGKKMSAQYSHSEIRMARFKGTTKDIGFIDERSFVGNAFRILSEAEMFVRRHLSIAIEFSNTSMERIESPQLPFKAVREAIVNAICHRDYVFKSGAIFLAIYDDRLEIWNTGELQNPLNFDDLRVRHPSVLRNSKIAHVFYIRKYIEKWGSGTTRIIKLCQELGVPEPEFSEYSGGFSVTFKFKKNDIISEKQEIGSLSNLTERQLKIIEILKSNLSGLPVSEILKVFNSSERKNRISLATLKRELDSLKEKNEADFEGKGRSTKWLFRK
jgi:ATP-dependent DNA helicase RecG